MTDQLEKLSCLLKTWANFHLQTQCFLFPLLLPYLRTKAQVNVTGLVLLFCSWGSLSLPFSLSPFFSFFLSFLLWQKLKGLSLFHCRRVIFSELHRDMTNNCGIVVQGKSSIFLAILGAGWSLAHSWVRGYLGWNFFIKTHWGISWYIIIKSRAGRDLQRSSPWLKPRSVYN